MGEGMDLVMDWTQVSSQWSNKIESMKHIFNECFDNLDDETKAVKCSQ